MQGSGFRKLPWKYKSAVKEAGFAAFLIILPMPVIFTGFTVALSVITVCFGSTDYKKLPCT
jgi:hypothetical protein